MINGKTELSNIGKLLFVKMVSALINSIILASVSFLQCFFVILPIKWEDLRLPSVNLAGPVAQFDCGGNDS